jgi:hypothetical protein
LAALNTPQDSRDSTAAPIRDDLLRLLFLLDATDSPEATHKSRLAYWKLIAGEPDTSPEKLEEARRKIAFLENQ